MTFSFGFDYFMGRAIDFNGNKSLVCLNFENHEIDEYVDVSIIGYDLAFIIAKYKQRVLLTQSPGIRKEEVLNPEEFEYYRSFNDIVTYDKRVIPKDTPSGRFYVRPEIRFEPLTPKELCVVREIYERHDVVKDFLNPFEYQPRLELDLSSRKN